MKTINVAVVGLGYWGPNLVRNYLKIPGVNVALGCDLLDKNLNAINHSYPTVKLTKDYLEVLNDKSIDVVSIATPVHTHFSLAQKALSADKHVVIEKPITQTSKQAEELIEIANLKKKLIMAGHTFVYSEAVKKMKDLLKKNNLGKVYYYDSTRINLGLIQSDTNVVWDLVPHDLSIISFLFPFKPLSVQAFGASFVNKKGEEIAHIFIKYENGFTAHIHVSWLSPVKIRKILIGGSKKMIVYDDIEPSEKVRIYDKGVSINPSKITPFSPAYRSGDVVIPHLEQNEALFTELTHFINCIRSNKKPLTDGEEGLKVVKLLEGVDKAIKKKIEIKFNEI